MSLINCFVGQRQSDINNVKQYIETNIISTVGFHTIMRLIEHYLFNVIKDFKIFNEIVYHSSYIYIKVDYANKDCTKTMVDKIKDDINNLIKFLYLEDFVCVSDTIVDDIIMVKLNIK